MVGVGYVGYYRGFSIGADVFSKCMLGVGGVGYVEVDAMLAMDVFDVEQMT